MQVAQPSAADTAVVLVAWGNAWLTGHVGLDEAADAVERTAGPHVMVRPGLPAEVPLRRALAELRMDGLSALRLALPVPGDPLGLTGPPALNSAAIEAGGAVLATLPDRTVGLVPAEDLRGSSYRGVRWCAYEARHGFADVPLLPEADRLLGTAVRDATDALMTVDDVSGGRPDVMNALAALREQPGGVTGGDGLAPGYPARAHRVAALAGRLSVVVDLARRVGDVNLTAEQMHRRSEALRDLDRAVRRALVAACNSAFDPVP